MPVSQTSADVLALPQRTRLKPMGGTGKSAYVALGCLLASVLSGLAARSYSKGGEAVLSTNAPSATVRLGNSSNYITDTAGLLRCERVPFGKRNLEIRSIDHEPLSTTIDVGWLSANQFTFRLRPYLLDLQINTNPGAAVTLNGEYVGKADGQGQLLKNQVKAGTYKVEVTLPGYQTFARSLHFSPQDYQHYISLEMSQEGVRQREEAMRREQEDAVRVQELLRTAHQQFVARQYQAALVSINEALRLQPSNPSAVQLKEQIVQTLNILKQ